MISDIKERNKELNQLLNCDFSKYESDELFPAEITHFRLSTFAQSSDIDKFRILDMNKD